MYKSLSLILALVATVVVAQGGDPLPAVTSASPAAPAAPAAPAGCSSCIFVADVAQVIWADYTSTATATAIVSEGRGRNGSTIRTTLSVPGRFSFTPGGGLINETPVTGSYVALTGTVFSFSGLLLTSPTAYNVFQRYTLFSLSPLSGSCTTIQQATASVAIASTYTIRANDPATAILDAQRSFARDVPTLTCEAGGVSVSMYIPVQTVQTTATSTTISTFSPTPASQLPQLSESVSSTSSSISSSTISSSITSSTSSSSSRIISTLVNANSTGIVTFPRVTQGIITGAAGSIYQPVYLSTGLVASLLVLPAIAAFML